MTDGEIYTVVMDLQPILDAIALQSQLVAGLIFFVGMLFGLLFMTVFWGEMK